MPSSGPASGLVAGVSWHQDGYDVAVGRDRRERRAFGLGETQPMIDFLASLGPDATTVVDATNGMLDGRLMSAGLRVWRADRDVLPPRPLFGAVRAEDLVDAAGRDLGRLTRLGDGGILTGHEDLAAAGIADSAPVIARLVAEGRCITSGGSGRNQVAITFDDGPFPPYTHRVLDVLARQQARATFFCVGLNVGGYPDVVARIAAEGDELGNHTWSHPFLPELTRDEFTEQVRRTGERIAEAAGADSVPRLFRPPYGSRNREVAGWLGEIGLRTVLWSVEPRDWEMPAAEVIVQRVLDEVRPGSVILLHDGGGDRTQTVDAVGPIIEGVRRKGLEFVPVGELAIGVE